CGLGQLNPLQILSIFKILQSPAPGYQENIPAATREGLPALKRRLFKANLLQVLLPYSFRQGWSI
ncbi:MAG: hypothetical protein ACLSAH_23750, partial [Bilophila wadsworthia]